MSDIFFMFIQTWMHDVELGISIFKYLKNLLVLMNIEVREKKLNLYLGMLLNYHQIYHQGTPSQA